MKKYLIIVLCGFVFINTANADVWKWVDNEGKTHFVDTETPIYTWVDEAGEQHYSDVPDHEDAISVELVWHSTGSLEELADSGDEAGSGPAYPGESLEERYEREQAEAYYCKRATEIYESYLNAPQLYRTNDAGEREYLSKEDKLKTLAETRAKRDALCS